MKASKKAIAAAPAPQGPVTVPAIGPLPNADAQKIAVVGMAVNYSGAPNVEAFWDLLTTNKVSHTPLAPHPLG